MIKIGEIAKGESIGFNLATLIESRLLIQSNSGGYKNNLGALRSLGLINYPGSTLVCLTGAGRAGAEVVDPIESLAAFQQSWYNMVSGSQARILKALIAHYPTGIGRDDLAEEVGVSPISSGFSNNLGSLRTMGAIIYPSAKMVRATELLFPEALA